MPRPNARLCFRGTFGGAVAGSGVYRALPVVLLVVTAGCLAGTPLDGSSADGPPAAAWAEDRGVNETALVHAHFRALREAGSFTANRTARVTIDGERRPPDSRPDWYRPTRITVEQVDLEDTRYVRDSVTVGHDRASSFISAEIDADRRRQCPDCGWEYRFTRRPEGDTLAQAIDRYRRDRMADEMADVFDDWNFTYDGTVTRDGETLYRYRGNWTFGKPVPPFQSPPNGSGTLLVTEDGVIRQWAYEYTGTARIEGLSEPVTVTLSYSMRYDDVGTTTVERPDWVDRGRENDPTPTTVTSG